MRTYTDKMDSSIDNSWKHVSYFSALISDEVEYKADRKLKQTVFHIIWNKFLIKSRIMIIIKKFVLVIQISICWEFFFLLFSY